MKRNIHYFILFIALLFANSALQAQCFSMTVQRVSGDSYGQVGFDITVNKLTSYLEEVIVTDEVGGNFKRCDSFPCRFTWYYDRQTYGNHESTIHCRSRMGCFQDEGCIVIIEGYLPQRNNSSTNATSP